ncbi:1528_t:CDS:2 [Scutellospora calospora]|uniref:1528_t:CDS:1 n=1 Tax=Scutellospora calospora TaxID=85575 RepID=A0ACA9KRX5_9GLOM|nr:1528_t:CDS:2 [Scutellospora calospora]
MSQPSNYSSLNQPNASTIPTISLKYHGSNIDNKNLNFHVVHNYQHDRNNDYERHNPRRSSLLTDQSEVVNNNNQDVDIESERTRLISQHHTNFGTLEDANDYRSLMNLGKSTVRQTIFNAVILFPQVDLTHLKLIVFLVITPVTWLPIHYLSYTSILGIFTASSLALVLLFDGLTKFEAPGSLWKPTDTCLLPPNWMVVPLAFGLINSAFSGHAVFPSLYRDMAKPSHYKKMVNSSYLISGVIYITVSILWLIVINPLSKYPLTLTPINLSIEVTAFRINMIGLFRSKIIRFLFIILSRSLVSFVIIGTSIIFPGFDRAMSLLGSCFSFLISSIFPLLCHLKMFGRNLSKKEIIWNILLLAICSVMASLGTVWTFLPRELLEDDR